MVDSELIKLNKVTKKFGRKKVLDSIDLSIPENKITCIMAASGEGKTTILKLMSGFYKPNKGKVTYLRKNVLKEMKNVEKYFGFATEEGSFYNKLTVKENLHYFGRLYHMRGKDIRKRTNELINFVGLDKAKKTIGKDLSIGMKKRLDLACALIHKPRVLIMDEPTADLDPVLRKDILDLIKEINKKETTVIMTTQIFEKESEIFDKVIVLSNSKIIEESTLKEIKKKYKKSNLNEVFNEIFQKVKTKKNSKKSKGKKSLIKKLIEKINFKNKK